MNNNNSNPRKTDTSFFGLFQFKKIRLLYDSGRILLLKKLYTEEKYR